MTYIILRDTFGDGLETFPDVRLEVIGDKEELSVYVTEAFDFIVSDDDDCNTDNVDFYDLNEIVICKILDDIDGVDTSTWVKEQIIKNKKQVDDEEYQYYLKLKEKVEKGV